MSTASTPYSEKEVFFTTNDTIGDRDRAPGVLVSFSGMTEDPLKRVEVSQQGYEWLEYCKRLYPPLENPGWGSWSELLSSAREAPPTEDRPNPAWDIMQEAAEKMKKDWRKTQADTQGQVTGPYETAETAKAGEDESPTYDESEEACEAL